MVRPGPLDRVENGGSGSDIRRWRENQRGETRQPKAFRPIDHPVCRRARSCTRRGLETAERAAQVRATAGRDSFCARRRRETCWSGQKKACGAVEQKKGLKQENKKSKKESAC